MPVETLSIQFTTTLWFDDVPGKFLDRVLVVARRLLLMSSSAIPASTGWQLARAARIEHLWQGSDTQRTLLCGFNHRQASVQPRRRARDVQFEFFTNERRELIGR